MCEIACDWARAVIAHNLAKFERPPPPRRSSRARIAPTPPLRQASAGGTIYDFSLKMSG